MVKIQIHEKTGQAYEDFFVKIMQTQSSTFKPVKAQGSIGDRKNDGFDTSRGHYYQVYAPEDLQGNPEKTIEKLVRDFKGLYDYWHNNVLEVKSFSYCLNDRYKGVYPTVHEALAEIGKEYDVETDAFLAKDLEDIVLSLPEDDIMSILGYIPSPEEITTIEFDILSEVIQYLLDLKNSYMPEQIKPNPNFERKIQFNQLNEVTASLLKTGRFHEHAVSEYFELNSKFSKNSLRDQFNGLYKSAKEKFSSADEIFFSILEEASPKREQAIQNAVIILMSYFFEYCDIYESEGEAN